jgi:hypothetical protein
VAHPLRLARNQGGPSLRFLQRVGFPISEPIEILKLSFVLYGEAPP